MKPTKEFKEWYLSNGWATIPFEDLPFEMSEGVYRAYFREKGIDVEIHKSLTGIYTYVYKEDYTETDSKRGYDSYPEAFEALVNKLFET